MHPIRMGGMRDNSYEQNGTQLVSQHELATILGCNHRTISNLLKRRKIPVIKVGTLNRFQPDRVIEALAGGSND